MFVTGRLKDLIIVDGVKSLSPECGVYDRGAIAIQMTQGAESMADRSRSVATGAEEMDMTMSGVASACEQVR